MQSLPPVHIYYAYFLSLNDDIVDTEKPDRICPPTFVVDDFRIAFTSIHVFFYERFKICINYKWRFIKFLVLMKLLIS